MMLYENHVCTTVHRCFLSSHCHSVRTFGTKKITRPPPSPAEHATVDPGQTKGESSRAVSTSAELYSTPAGVICTKLRVYGGYSLHVETSRGRSPLK